MPLITNPIMTSITGTNVLTPVQNPQDARWNAGRFAASKTLYAGQILGSTTNGLDAFANAGSGTNIAGLGLAVGINMYTLTTDASQNVYYGGSTVATPLNMPLPSSPYFTSGDFDQAQLFSIDSTARTSLGATILGGANTNWVHIP